MKQIFMILSFTFLLYIVPAHCMWYVVDPQDHSEILEGRQKGTLMQKFMIHYALYDSNLDEQEETDKVESYCKAQAKKQKNGKCTLRCPDKNCGSEFTNAKGDVNGLFYTLKVHWFASTIHQAKFHGVASTLIAESDKEAKELYAHSSKKIEVIPFPILDNGPTKKPKTEPKTNLDSTKQMTDAPKQAMSKPLSYYLFEQSDKAGAFFVFTAQSKEKVLEDFFRSKQLRKQLVISDDVKDELLNKTRKQQKVQGDDIRILICPAQGCKHEHEEKGQQPLLDKIVAALVVHYAANHKQESPCVKSILDLMATDPALARKNIDKGN